MSGCPREQLETQHCQWCRPELMQVLWHPKVLWGSSNSRIRMICWAVLYYITCMYVLSARYAYICIFWHARMMVGAKFSFFYSSKPYRQRSNKSSTTYLHDKRHLFWLPHSMSLAFLIDPDKHTRAVHHITRQSERQCHELMHGPQAEYCLPAVFASVS